MTEPRNYYTAFILFAQDSKTGEKKSLHCTHKYLGPLDLYQLGDVTRICRNYFKQPREFPLAVFNQPSIFGPPDKPKEVLKSFIDRSLFFLDLREQLDYFRKDDFPVYNPHITVSGYSNLIGIFQGYAIMMNDKVLFYWENGEWQKSQSRGKRKNHLSMVSGQTT